MSCITLRRSQKDETEVIKQIETRDMRNITIFRGNLRMKNRVTGYDRKNIFDRTRLSKA